MLFPFAPSDKAYYTLWAATQPLIWLSYLLVVAELYNLSLRQYRGIYSLGRWFFFGAVALSVIISALTVLPTISTVATVARRPTLLYYYAFIERGLVTSLGIFLLLLLVLVAWFAVPLSRNLLRHCTIYSVYFFANNVTALYWHTGSRQATYASNIGKLSVAVGCYMCWVFLLTRRGEDRTTSLSLGRNPIEEQRLLGQLENLNATLLRTARK